MNSPTILACTDGSLYSASIYQHASWAASRLNAAIHVLHVIEREETPAPTDLSGSIGFHASSELLEELTELDEAHSRVARLRGKAILDDAARQLGISGLSSTAPVTTTQRHGSLVETLDEFEPGAALAIIGKRGEHADFSKGHLGSNLERVIRSAKIPILVASREFKPIRRFLIAFDGGTSSLKAIHDVATQPLLRGLQCHIVSIGKPGAPLSRELDSAVLSLRGAGFEVTSDFLQGDPDDTIAAEVAAREIDLLVMGAYGHSRVRQLILGSTTTHLIRTCLVPILLYR